MRAPPSRVSRKPAPPAAVATAVAPNVDFFPAVHAAGSDAIRVGLIGCGGRGPGAADHLLSSPGRGSVVPAGDGVPHPRTPHPERLARKFAGTKHLTPR